MSRPAAASPSAIAKLYSGAAKKKENVRYEARQTTPASQKPQMMATGRIAKRYRPVRPTGSIHCFSTAMTALTIAIATAPVMSASAV